MVDWTLRRADHSALSTVAGASRLQAPPCGASALRVHPTTRRLQTSKDAPRGRHASRRTHLCPSCVVTEVCPRCVVPEVSPRCARGVLCPRCPRGVPEVCCARGVSWPRCAVIPRAHLGHISATTQFGHRSPRTWETSAKTHRPSVTTLTGNFGQDFGHDTHRPHLSGTPRPRDSS